MAYSSTSQSSGAADDRKSKIIVGFINNAKKHKHSFIQLAAVTGILLLSCRSLGQKYRIHNLQEDTYELQEEQDSLSGRMKNIKSALLHEAALDSTGLVASRLRRLFGEED
ncbi:hypothetical protein K1719_019866 [Acacia pycnantha]|nr:hypothetical protein K1719_019866 [Acacia pycnantha]